MSVYGFEATKYGEIPGLSHTVASLLGAEAIDGDKIVIVITLKYCAQRFNDLGGGT